MTGFIRTLLIAFGLLAAGTAIAVVPSPATSTCPGCLGTGSDLPYIRVVGHRGVSTGLSVAAFSQAHQSSPTAGNPLFDITVRDFAGNPVVGSVVELRTGACSDLILCEIPFGNPGLSVQTIDCTAKKVSAITNTSGKVTLALPGAGLLSGFAPAFGATTKCIGIYADNVLLAMDYAVIYDPNGGNPAGIGAATANGVDALDISLLLRDIGIFAMLPPNNIYYPRSDYSALNGCVGFGDCDAINAGDLSVGIQLVGESAGGVGSAAGCSTLVPDEVTGINYCP